MVFRCSRSPASAAISSAPRVADAWVRADSERARSPVLAVARRGRRLLVELDPCHRGHLTRRRRPGASRGARDGRQVVHPRDSLLDADRDAVPPARPFIPELPHAQVELDGVLVHDADILPGDGYDDYLKPFRTIEVIYVHTALAGHLIGVARWRGFSESWWRLDRPRARHADAHADAKAATTHVALAGTIERTLRLVGSETSGRHASAARRTETTARMAGDASTPRIRYGRTPRMTAATFLS